MSLIRWTIGSDEAGVGNMAGDIIVVAVALPGTFEDLEVTDSKKLSEKKRRAIYQKYKDTVIWEIARFKPAEIDAASVTSLCLKGHVDVQRKLRGRLNEFQDHEVTQVVDGFTSDYQRRKFDRRIICEAKAESKYIAVAMASCFATSLVDQAMIEYGVLYPKYKFASHKAYGVTHMAEIKELGVLDIHRRSFSPVRKALL
jgi:ribonuclease HII